jgi:Chitobiase/beta-hexosaminidase C-terminal domain
MALIADVVAGTVITVAWGNGIRDQTIASFPDATTRDAQIGSPAAGRLTYQTTPNSFTYHDGIRWCTLPGTLLKRHERLTVSSTTTTEVGVIRLPIGAVPAGQAIFIGTSALWLATDNATDVVEGRIRYTTDGSTPTTASSILTVASARQRTGFQIYPQAATISAFYTPPAAQTLTILLTVRREAGGGNVFIDGIANVVSIGLFAMAMGTDAGNAGTDI